MFALTFLTFTPNVVIASLIMYIVLFILCMYAFVKRSSVDRNPSLYHALAVAIFGLLNAILLLAASDINAGYTIEVLPAGLFFGLTLTPLTWMAGIALFLSLDTDRIPIPILVGYFFTFVQFVLMIVVASFITIYFHHPNGDQYAALVYSNTYIANVSFNWVFFFLYSILGIYYRHDVNPKVFYTLIVFEVLNTVRLATETIFLVQGGDLSIDTYLYIFFFFTDFVSCISLYVSVFFWDDIEFD